MELIIQLIAGAVGGNAAGAVLKNFSLGTLGNSLVGILGGGLGGQILGLLGGGSVAAGGGTDLTSIIATFATGGVGGGALMAVVGVIRNMMANR